MGFTGIGARGDAQVFAEENYLLKNEFKSIGLSSALDVLHLSRESFMRRYGEVLGDAAEARKVYDWALETADQVAKRYHAGSRLESVMSLSALNRGTPNISVMDNRGLSVRQLGYYRREEQVAAEVRIGVQHYDNRGQLITSIDPRLSKAYLKDRSTVIPNQQQKSSLLGGVLESENVDAGKRVVLSDCRGKALWSSDSRETEREFEYDELGRVKRVYEREDGKESVCSERFLYGDPSNTEKGQNAVGQLLAQYGSSGYSITTDYSVLGQLKKESQTFLKADSEAHWTEDEAENQKRLEEDSYISEYASNALGEALSQIDAKGNERKSVYDISGQIEELRLKLKTGTEKILSKERKYSASGQLEEENLGNGIRMHYRYEGATQRLSKKEAKRVSDHQSLQYLHYTYDPVGNILSIEDKAKAIEHFKNEKTESINHYTYDSFYQLIESQGLESSQAGKETPKLPQAIPLGSSDASRLVNYKRTYQYDAGGNLFQIQHHGANPYTQQIEIDSHSNRGIEERETGPTLKESFDGNGNLLYLNVGQPLSWDTRNQLKEVIQVERENTADKEIYLYDSQGARVEKRRNYLAQTQIHTERVRYLPGLELREHWQSDSQGKHKKIKEELQVIQAQAGEAVRVLHWEQGKPKEIENGTIYYSLSDQIGSNQLELNEKGEVISYESYYPYGGTAVWATKNQIEADYKYQRYSGKERDATGLYYYGYRYYIPWLGRWVNADPSGIAEGLNLFQMVNNNPITFYDPDGRVPIPVSNDETPPPLPSSPPPNWPSSSTWPGSSTASSERVSASKSISRKSEIKRLFLAGPIKEIGRFEAKFAKGVVVDVTTSVVSIAGNDVAYLLRGPSHPDRKSLFIHTHGVFGSSSGGGDFEGFITLEENMPTITLLGPHRKALVTQMKNFGNVYAEVSYRGVTLSSENAEQDFQTSGLSAITGSSQPRTMRNYSLSKFQTEGSNLLRAHKFEDLAEFIYNNPGDALALRKSASESITVRDIMTFAQDAGYENVIWHFCRSFYSDPDNAATRFFPSKIEKSSNPSFHAWKDL